MYLADEHKIWVCKGEDKICMLPKMANRHGLIAGATGTGKTVTLKVLAESFSEMGVPVFLADIKGDVSGMCKAGESSEGFQKRLHKLGIENFEFKGFPVRFFDVFGKKGHPVRTTISEMGPDLLSRLLELNTTQSGIMTIIFKIADDQGLLLLDLKDLRSMVQYVGDNAAQFKTAYGNVSAQSVGAIQRALLRLEEQGGDVFFGEPALDIRDWLAVADDGRGYINLLHCVELFQNPLLYSTFLLWMLSELYDLLPELGTGEVLVSLLDADGVPTMVERAYVMPPRSYLGVADDTLRNQLIASSPLYSKYAEAVDRESAYEILSAKAQQDAEAAARAQEEAALQKELRSRSAAAKKEPPTVAEKLISKTMTRMENKAVDTIVRGIFNQMKKWF